MQAFDYQLKATSVQWLYTDVWSAPTTPPVTNQAELDAFVQKLVTGISVAGPTPTPTPTPTVTGTTVQAVKFKMPKRMFVGKKYRLRANTKSQLSIAYSVTGPATLVGNQLTIDGAGSVVVTARHSGSPTYAPASVTRTATVPIPKNLTK